MLKVRCPSCRGKIIIKDLCYERVVQCSFCQSFIRVTRGICSSSSAPAVSILPALSVLSPDLAANISSGRKYWRWTDHLDVDKLEALLWAIGVFGSGFAEASHREPRFYPRTEMEVRMRRALMVLARVQSVGRVADAFFRFELSEHVSAFTEEYRERLSRGKHTAWAQGLDECNLGAVLWMVGEDGVHAGVRMLGQKAELDYEGKRGNDSTLLLNQLC